MKTIKFLLIAMFVLAAGHTRSFAGTCPNPLPAISGSSTNDQSSLIQCYIDNLQNTGGLLTLPAGTIYAQGLSLPDNIIIQGQGVGATTLMLPAHATAPYLIANSTYINGNPWSNVNGGIRDLTLDGNKSNNTNKAFHALLILQDWRFIAEDCGIQNSPMHGILYTFKKRPNGASENMIRRCGFDSNNGAGFYAGPDDSILSDFYIQDSFFDANGSAGYYQIYLACSAGFHVVNNQLYGSTFGELYASDTGATEIIGNNFDGTQEQKPGGTNETVVVSSNGGWGNTVINNNIFHTHASNLGLTSKWFLLNITADSNSGMTVTGNSFYSDMVKVTALRTDGSFPSTIIVSGNSVSTTPTPY